MRVLIQRVSESKLSIDGELYSSISKGLLVLVGVEDSDTEQDIDYLCNKIVNMRIFPDENGVMNLSLIDVNADLMAVSQFTLMAQTRKGNRPSYIKASKADFSLPMYEKFCAKLESLISHEIARGVFGADMQISLINDGPVTIFIDSNEK